MVLGNNGILTRAEDSVRISKIKEAEEFAQITYADRQIDEIIEGKVSTIAGTISDLKAAGYTIKELLNENSKVTGIVLNSSKIKMDKNSEKDLTYTLVYGEGSVRYFIEIAEKYYEILFDNGTITINTEAIDLGKTDKEPEITVESSNNDLVFAELLQEKIVLSSKNELGEVTIIIREMKSGVTEICTVKVMTLITGIMFEQSTINLEKGKNIDLSSIIKINPEDSTEKIIYSSENENVATVSEEGLVIGISGGTTVITAGNEDGSKTATCSVNVVIPAEGISLDESNLEINKDNTESLTVTLNPPDTTEPIIWNSEKTDVVTVMADETGKNATITAIGAGTSQITVTCGTQSAYCTVSVKVPATRVWITPSDTEINLGETKQLTAAPTPSDTTDTVVWETSDASIATVSDSGLVTAIKSGQVTITATYGEAKFGASIKTSYKPKDITYSWEELVKIAGEISNSYPNIDGKTEFTSLNVDGNTYTLGIGDTKTIKINNKNIKIRILGFNHDLLVNKNSYGGTNTYAGITFECLDFLSSSAMTAATTTDGGWAASQIWTTLNGGTYSSSIEELKIKQVIKEYGATRGATEVSYSEDYLWLLSEKEIFGGGMSRVGEGILYAYYRVHPCKWNGTSRYNRKPSEYTGTALGGRSWWMRSIPYGYGNEDVFSRVTEAGQSHYYSAGGTMGVAPGFCI